VGCRRQVLRFLLTKRKVARGSGRARALCRVADWNAAGGAGI